MRVSRADTDTAEGFPWAQDVRREIEHWQPSERLPERWPHIVRLPVRRGPGRVRLVLVCGLVVAGLYLTITTTGAGPNGWWIGMQHAVQNAVRQLGGPQGGAPSPPSRSVPAGAVTTSPGPAASATPGGAATPAATPSPDHGSKGGGSSSAPGVGVTVTNVPSASKPAPGVSVGTPPQGGMTGSVSEGPVTAGGTIDGGGIRGCVGVWDQASGTYICGSVTLPVSVPLPNLPAPKVPDATQITPTQ